MKTFQKFALLAVLFSGVLLSCSKEKNGKLDHLEGSYYQTYTGKQGAGVEEPGSFLQLKLEDHGTLLTFNSNNALPCSGSWEIEGNHFKGFFRQNPNNVKITLAGTVDEVENKIYGTWGYGENTIGGGSFYVKNEKTILAKKESQPASLLMIRFLF